MQPQHAAGAAHLYTVVNPRGAIEQLFVMMTVNRLWSQAVMDSIKREMRHLGLLIPMIGGSSSLSQTFLYKALKEVGNKPECDAAR